MLKVNHWAVAAAAMAAMAVSFAWYSSLLFGNAWLQLRGATPSGMPGGPHVVEMLAELARSLVIAYVLARFVVQLNAGTWRGAFILGFWVWLGFHAMVLLGAVIHEHLPWPLYAIHTGDGLVRTLLMAVILGAWR